MKRSTQQKTFEEHGDVSEQTVRQRQSAAVRAWLAGFRAEEPPDNPALMMHWESGRREAADPLRRGEIK